MNEAVSKVNRSVQWEGDWPDGLLKNSATGVWPREENHEFEKGEILEVRSVEILNKFTTAGGKLRDSAKRVKMKLVVGRMLRNPCFFEGNVRSGIPVLAPFLQKLCINPRSLLTDEQHPR